MQGTEVWLSGQKVGLVRDVKFRGVDVDTARRLVIVFDLLAKYQSLVRRNSFAQIRSGSTLIGSPVLFVEPGTAGSPPIQDGDTLRTDPQNDAEGMASRFAVGSREFPTIIANVKLLDAQLQGVRGTAGAILNGDRAAQDFGAFVAHASELTQQATRGGGTIGLAMNGGDMQRRLQLVMARADSIRALMASNQTTLGRFRRDSSLMQTVADVRNEVSVMRALLDQPRGTAGRVLHDEAAQRQLASMEKDLGALMTDLKKRPLRYVAF
jgi:phospholipid/cholesterol/gamma-HCH transport system substrate-binding protein